MRWNIGTQTLRPAGPGAWDMGDGEKSGDDDGLAVDYLSNGQEQQGSTDKGQGRDAEDDDSKQLELGACGTWLLCVTMRATQSCPGAIWCEPANQLEGGEVDCQGGGQLMGPVAVLLQAQAQALDSAAGLLLSRRESCEPLTSGLQASGQQRGASGEASGYGTEYFVLRTWFPGRLPTVCRVLVPVAKCSPSQEGQGGQDESPQQPPDGPKTAPSRLKLFPVGSSGTSLGSSLGSSSRDRSSWLLLSAISRVYLVPTPPFHVPFIHIHTRARAHAHARPASILRYNSACPPSPNCISSITASYPGDVLSSAHLHPEPAPDPRGPSPRCRHRPLLFCSTTLRHRTRSHTIAPCTTDERCRRLESRGSRLDCGGYDNDSVQRLNNGLSRFSRPDVIHRPTLPTASKRAPSVDNIVLCPKCLEERWSRHRVLGGAMQASPQALSVKPIPSSSPRYLFLTPLSMLEDPAHQDVARWGKDGDTFVVVENEKFTRSILPKHFKHSNMASFVRQLNKYDFHKVRQTNDSGSSANGANTLEFKHPNFRVGSKDDLDNIRRKAPAPRRAQATEDFTASHHISVMNEQLTATQQQVQQLQELFTEVSQTNRLLVNEVLTLQKMLNAQKGSQHEMLNYLSTYGERNRMAGPQQMHQNVGALPMDGDNASPELRRARELLSSVTPDSIADRELERLQGVYGSPADSAVVMPQASMPMMHDPMNDINRYPVYPVGQTVGIDPFHSDHIHKIPYAMPNNDASGGGLHDITPPQQMTNAPPPSGSNSSALLWGPRKPRIFLVEDDPTCSKIGIKFLKSMGCEVEHAGNGADAYSRINTVGRDHFDMIFMDIIMPRLDGVSTTMYIRQDCPAIPIVAMTSNIRSDEVHCYFEHGMNGVLAKPFTKGGMQKIVENHLGYLLKNYDPATSQEAGSGYVVGGAGYMNPPGSLTSGTTFKFETTPTPPATGSTWSPGQMPQASPMSSGLDQGYGMVNGGSPYGMTPTSATRPNFPTSMSHAPSNPQGRMDGQSPPEKRQRTYV
ncbi:hypothetical protein G7046_g2171 [Stylonectria norvegica]|nr:hypothetical protein G7046_g2171 [Stylonectria norvegica]